MPSTCDKATLIDVADRYVDIMGALEGASAAAAQHALSMALLMTGEYLGLDGKELLDWIEQAAARAKAGATPTAPAHALQ